MAFHILPVFDPVDNAIGLPHSSLDGPAPKQILVIRIQIKNRQFLAVRVMVFQIWIRYGVKLRLIPKANNSKTS